MINNQQQEEGARWGLAGFYLFISCCIGTATAGGAISIKASSFISTLSAAGIVLPFWEPSRGNIQEAVAITSVLLNSYLYLAKPADATDKLIREMVGVGISTISIFNTVDTIRNNRLVPPIINQLRSFFP